MMQQLAWALGLLLFSDGIYAAQVQTWSEPITGMSFVSIPKGCFQMGSSQPVEPPADTMWGEVRYTATLSGNEKPQHEVCVDAFWLGRYEVSVKEWLAIMGDEVSAQGDDLPVTRVPWEQARLFAQRLSERSGQHLRLPTEAEWEYACRAGATAEGLLDREQLAELARYGLGSPTAAEVSVGRVGASAANAFGVHDMLGNVWEWVADTYHADAYARHTLYNPHENTPSKQHVIRGGSYRTEFVQVRCSRRGHQSATEPLNTIGFRLVRER